MTDGQKSQNLRSAANLLNIAADMTEPFRSITDDEREAANDLTQRAIRILAEVSDAIIKERTHA